MSFNSINLSIRDFLDHNDIKRAPLNGRQKDRIIHHLVTICSTIEDPRVKGRVIYPISTLIACIFMATLAGAESSYDVVDFWECEKKLYKRIFKTDVIPSHDTFRRILSLIPNEAMNTLLVSVIQSLYKTLKKVIKFEQVGLKLISVDGKEERGTGRKANTSEEIKNLQILNVYDQETGTCIFSDPIREKTNEIPHAQELLKLLNLKDSVVTFDALHTQKETIRIIKGQNGDYVGGLKGNQCNLFQYCLDLFDDDYLTKLSNKGALSHLKTSEIKHNQLEERDFYLHTVTPYESKHAFLEWVGIKSVVCYKKHTIHNVTGKVTDELRCYISSLKDLEDIAYCIRGHWAIENKLHWCLDTVFHEDGMHIVDRQAATNQSIINKAALSICKLMEELLGKKQKSIRGRRKSFGWNFEYSMALMLSLINEKAFEKALIVNAK